MRIYHIADTINEAGGGTSVYICNLASATAKLKVGPVEVAAINQPEFGKLVATSPEVKVRTFQPKRPYLYGRSHGFGEYLESAARSDDSVFHVHRMWRLPLASASNYAHRFKRPCIVSPHGSLNKFSMSQKPVRKKIIWWLMEGRRIRRADMVLATCLSEAEDIAALLPEVPIAVIPPGTDLPVMREPGPAREFKVALFLSRFNPKKGLISLIKAWGILKPASWKLVIVGFDEEGVEAQCRKAVADLKLEDSVIFAGPALKDRKWEHYFNADIFILPTLDENFGIVIAEALASGLPVITTKGAPWEDLKLRNCGWWIDIGVEPLVNAMREALELDPSELRAMGGRGRTLVEEKFTWEACARKMVEIYKWALGGGARPEDVLWKGAAAG
ncbi:MAG TPA: glycosyltransferase [bacterium]|nr:glycosyltransferase [bacterium]